MILISSTGTVGPVSSIYAYFLVDAVADLLAVFKTKSNVAIRTTKWLS